VYKEEKWDIRQQSPIILRASESDFVALNIPQPVCRTPVINQV